MADKTTQQAESEARALLEDAGYVVLRAKSYRAAQNRQWSAENAKEWAEREAAIYRKYADEALDEQRRLSDRLTFVYGVARAVGASVEDLTQAERSDV